jgi:hypothetical protein
MIEWIKKHLDPPGNERKNRRSIFSFIGRVFGIVKDDAVKAHNAFFPYLCDADKLRRHGKSLMIPELPFDTEKNYRDRVATASFYLMRAGERAYIHEQLRAYLGNRYEISDEFLEVYLKTSELSTEERIWAYGFLDGILDPNISFSIAEWFNFHGEVFGGVFPKINNIFHVPAFEDQAAAHTALSPSITKQYFVPAGENDAQSFLTLVPKLDCIINILSEEVII